MTNCDKHPPVHTEADEVNSHVLLACEGKELPEQEPTSTTVGKYLKMQMESAGQMSPTGFSLSLPQWFHIHQPFGWCRAHVLGSRIQGFVASDYQYGTTWGETTEIEALQGPAFDWRWRDLTTPIVLRNATVFDCGNHVATDSLKG